MARLPKPPVTSEPDSAAMWLIDHIRAYAAGQDGVAGLTVEDRAIGMHHILWTSERCFNAALAAEREQVVWEGMVEVHGMAVGSLQRRVDHHYGRGRIGSTAPRVTTADRIMALDWSRPWYRREIRAALPDVGIDTLKGALRRLSGPGGPLERVGDGTYRRGNDG